MTQPPERPPSIYTRLDGSPLPRYEPLPVPGEAAVDTAGWPDLSARERAAGQQFVLATWSSRLWAYLIDALLFGTLAWIVMLPVGVALGLTVSEAAEYFSRLTPLPESIVNPTPFYVAVAFQAMLPGIALSLALLRMDGQSPGKRALGIRVVRADGMPLDSRTAFRRELGAKSILMSLLALVTLGVGWLLNFLWPLWDREHRAGHDALVGTRVVQAPKGR
jgi:uncharacterized RDD family membrane protein YckC